MTERFPIQARTVTYVTDSDRHQIPNSPTELARIIACELAWLTNSYGQVFDESGHLLAESMEDLADQLAAANCFVGDSWGLRGILWDSPDSESVGGLPNDGRLSGRLHSARRTGTAS